ncbi:hypothetical protein DZC31_20755 [Stenotrophomonas rhizophila]|nr:hypothetical protein DZC31_20755 [Stenotrophomonas rhizophila]
MGTPWFLCWGLRGHARSHRYCTALVGAGVPAKASTLIHAKGRLCGNSKSTNRSAVGCGS